MLARISARCGTMACVEMEAAFDELEPELRGQTAGQLRGQWTTREFVRRQGVIADELTPWRPASVMPALTRAW
jgi:hypothetical protein